MIIILFIPGKIIIMNIEDLTGVVILYEMTTSVRFVLSCDL